MRKPATITVKRRPRIYSPNCTSVPFSRGCSACLTHMGHRQSKCNDLQPVRQNLDWIIDVRYWHLTDVDADGQHVRFQG